MTLLLTLANDGNLEARVSPDAPALRIAQGETGMLQLWRLLASQRGGPGKLGTPANPTQAMVDHFSDDRWASVSHLIKTCPYKGPKGTAKVDLSLEELDL